MKTLLTLFVLLFSSSVVAEEQYLECTEMKAKMDCNSETCNLLGYEKTENIYYLKFFDVPLYIAYFSPKDMESKKVKDFYKNNSLKAIEFYEDKTFTKNKGDYEYSQLTRMIQIEDLKVLLGSKENPLKKYYVLYAPDFRKYVHQEIIIINRYTLEAKFIMDYRFFQNSETKMKELRNLTDELIEKKYISKSLLDNKEYEIHKFKPMPWDYQCEIIEKLNKLL